jgi:hypothetical protein
MIVHGGYGGYGYQLDDTWVLINADATGGTPTWMPLPTGDTKPALQYPSAAYDAANNRLIVHGGFGPGGTNNFDTWVLTNANGLGENPVWTKLEPPTTYPLSWWQTGGYDPATNTLISFFGNASVDPDVNQVWLLKNANGLGGNPDWTELYPNGVTPSVRCYSTAVYDSNCNKMVVFGGGFGGAMFNEAWRLDHANGQGGLPEWTRLVPAEPAPTPSWWPSVVYNPGTDRMITFGGFSPTTSQTLGDVWVLTEAMGPAPNSPPTCNAGGSLSILSKDQGTAILNGTAGDPEGDALTYRWLKGTTELVAWQPVQNGQAPLNLGPLPFFSLGQHSLTLEVSDGQVTSRDAMVLTVENSAPNAGPTGGGVYQVNTPVILAGEVSDFDGDLLSYKWMEGTMELNQGVVPGIAGGQPVSLPSYIISSLPVGEHQLILQVSDGVNAPTAAGITVKVIDTTPPTLAPVASPTILWPPNHQMVPINITTNAQDNGGMPVTLTAQVSCNEPNDGSQYWTTPLIDPASGIITLQLQASRLGKGTGRSYIIDITATDQAGNTSSAKAVVTVPHDRGKN